MSDLLRRDAYHSKKVELLRVVVVFAVLLAMAAAWHGGVRCYLVNSAAKSSVGCLDRRKLIDIAIRQSGTYTIAEDREHYICPWNCAKPDWIAIWAVSEAVPPGASSPIDTSRFNIFDRQLRLRGDVELSSGKSFVIPPFDADGDGVCEVICKPFSGDWRSKVLGHWYAVVRLGEDHNEIVGAMQVSPDQTGTGNAWLEPHWRDVNGDGLHELVFASISPKLDANGMTYFGDPEYISVFEWIASGGNLRSLAEDDDRVSTWLPPDGKPVRVEKGAVLDAVLREIFQDQ